MRLIDARQWFTSSRRPLLAAFGVGTIDQALMATMPLKHAGLRLFALSGKVVVMDEVHSFDPYTSELIDSLIERLLQLNCSVIILVCHSDFGTKTSSCYRGPQNPFPLSHPDTLSSRPPWP